MNDISKDLYELRIKDVGKAAKTLLLAFYKDPFSEYLIRAIRSGYLSFTRKVTRDMVIRFKHCVGELKKIHISTVNTPHWYLNFIGVDPPFRGQGIASTHLDKMFIKIDREELPCYLEAFTEENVRWYEKYNFKVIDRFEICNSRVWALLRE